MNTEQEGGLLRHGRVHGPPTTPRPPPPVAHDPPQGGGRLPTIKAESLTYAKGTFIRVRTGAGTDIQIECGEGSVIKGFMRIRVDGETYGVFESGGE